MIQGELRSKIDQIWDAFWSGGISNPLEVIEQLTYLMFLRRLDDTQKSKENKANRLGTPIEEPVFADNEQQLRWSVFRDTDTTAMFDTVANKVFPWLRNLGGEESTYKQHMRDARFTIPTPALLSKVVDMIDKLPSGDRDTKGDLYEYMLSKIATSGQNGQFRTPRHIIELMVEMTQPGPRDKICDPACGTAGFLVASASYLEQTHPEMMFDPEQSEHFHRNMFHGFDFDSTMLRIGSMNMLLHDVQSPDIRYRDSLAQAAEGESDRYTLILANPPFAGSLDYDSTSKQLKKDVKTKKTELLFLALFLRLLKLGGRAAVIVPEGVLSGSSKAHMGLRQTLVEDQQLEAVVQLPSGVFKPYAGVSTAILLFKRTDSGGTANVWFYDLQADGLSLDGKRNPLLPDTKLGAVPIDELSEDEHEKNNLPDVLARWNDRNSGETHRARTEQSFCVPKEDIAAADYDLRTNQYKEVFYEETEHRPPKEIIAELQTIETHIQDDIKRIEGMLQ